MNFSATLTSDWRQIEFNSFQPRLISCEESRFIVPTQDDLLIVDFDWPGSACPWHFAIPLAAAVARWRARRPPRALSLLWQKMPPIWPVFFFFFPFFLIQVINCVEWSGESFQRPYLKEWNDNWRHRCERRLTSASPSAGPKEISMPNFFIFFSLFFSFFFSLIFLSSRPTRRNFLNSFMISWVDSIRDQSCLSALLSVVGFVAVFTARFSQPPLDGFSLESDPDGIPKEKNE